MPVQQTYFLLKSTVNSHLPALDILQALDSPMNWIWGELSGKQGPNRGAGSVMRNLRGFHVCFEPSEH